MVNAPFELHQVAVDHTTGQARGTYWYMAPFRLWRYTDCNRKRCTVWDYARGTNAQYIGLKLAEGSQRFIKAIKGQIQ